MLGLLLRRLVLPWFYRLSPHNIPQMPLFALVDLPIIAVLPRNLWMQHMRRLCIMQRHFTQRSYTGLASIYPRHHLITYLYMLFAWARYCEVLPKLLTEPDRNLLPEIFIRYICEIDHYLDQFDSRQLLQEQPQRAWRRAEARAIAHELCLGLELLALPPDLRWRFLRMVVVFRRVYFEEMRCSAAFQACDLTVMLRHKERTAGDLWRTWALLLGMLYEVPNALADRAAGVMFAFGMMIQVLDDIADLPTDYRTATPNLFVTLIEQRPDELAALQAYLDTHSEAFLSVPWSRKHLSHAHEQVMSIYEQYAEQLLAAADNPTLTHEMFTTTEYVRRRFSR